MKRNLGNFAIAGLVAMNVLLWTLFGPTEGVSKNFPQQVVAETLSSSAMILWACGLVLSNKPRLLEPYFGGLDRMYVTHKSINILALLIIVVHLIIVPTSDKQGPGVWIAWFVFPSILIMVLLTIAPRVPLISNFARLRYNQWRNLHRYMGVLYILGATHMLMAEPLILHAPVVFAYVESLIAMGVLAYLYKQFLWERLRKRIPYTVRQVRKLNGTVAEVTLQPAASRLAHRAGQFTYVHFDSDPTLREPHPFTISSSPQEEDLRLSIKSSGDWTQYLHDHLQAGANAYLDGPYGEFDYRKGGERQVWIAGGIGITPFISWVRDLREDPRQSIDLYYSTTVPEEMLFAEEIGEAAAGFANLRVHISHSTRDGRLTVDKILASSGDAAGKDFFLCGPPTMIEAFRAALLEKGVKARRIHYEEFNFR
ncbi:MAG TPA: ferric reductase-like transmembrane domain-containing protein [Anaerolineales bacterium]